MYETVSDTALGFLEKVDCCVCSWLLGCGHRVLFFLVRFAFNGPPETGGEGLR